MLTIAFIGFGAIGGEVAKILAHDAGVRIAGALVARPGEPRASGIRVFSSVAELVETRPDFVIECARQQALNTYGPQVLASGLSLIAASVGALAEERTLDALMQAATSGGAQLFIPAGALAGIDALAAARLTGLSSVTYTRRAPPATWVKSGALSATVADRLRIPHTVFEGTAREAALRFPKNANVAATVALAGLGFDATRAVLLADPAVSANIHEIVAVGAFGRFRTEIAAQPIAGTTSSAIVAGSVARAALSRTQRIPV